MHDIIYPLITVCPLCYNTSVAPSQPPFRRHPARQVAAKNFGMTAQNRAQTKKQMGLPTLLQMGKNGSGPHTDALGILALPPLRSGSVRSLRARSLCALTASARSLLLIHSR